MYNEHTDTMKETFHLDFLLVDHQDSPNSLECTYDR